MSKIYKKKISCVAIVVSDGEKFDFETRKRNQLKDLNDYAVKHNLRIDQVMVCSVPEVLFLNKTFSAAVQMVFEGKVEGVLVQDIRMLTSSISDIYKKTGLVHRAGGTLYTLRNGILKLPIEEVNDEAIGQIRKVG